MDKGERRQQARYAIRAEIEVLTSRESVGATTVDMSTDGIRILSPKPIQPGTMVTIQFPLKTKAYLRGEVIWVLESATLGLPAYQIGVGMESIGIGDRSGVGQAEKLGLIQTILEKLQARDGAD